MFTPIKASYVLLLQLKNKNANGLISIFIGI